jgi:DNA repair protein RecN (Recombination protein N)
MLKNLSIKNYALIDSLEINFSGGLSIITGETGAGKSILLGALNLILGQRSEAFHIKNPEVKCIIEGVFNIEQYGLEKFFSENELDYSNQTILRREIKANGTSRAFVNDTPVNLNVLKNLGYHLIDIHSQHQNLLLSNSNYQLKILDSYAGNQKLLSEYYIQYNEYNRIKKELEGLKEKENELKRQQDFIQYQFDELEMAELKAGEQEQLENEQKILENSEVIKSALNHSYELIGEGEMNIITLLKTVKQQLGSVSKWNTSLEELLKRIDSVYIEIQDINEELNNQNNHIHHDPARLEGISERLDKLYHLLKKHQVNSTEKLIILMDKFSAQLHNVHSLEVQIENAEKDFKIVEGKIDVSAKRLSESRKKSAPAFSVAVEKILFQLGMVHSKIKVEIEDVDFYGHEGIDKMAFLFAPNKGSSFNELSKVASGGEMSRIMLAVKSIISKSRSLPAIIFDEIDTGVSGEIAQKLGSIMEDMGKSMQVIAITHLPQIASRGKNHYKVYKETEKDSTYSNIKLLGTKERIEEIAKMLSGEEVTDIAVKNAKELLKV